ncbi:MAG TPA: DNA mismatch repair protein MutS [Chthoniobacterales bacterium]|nr:DNA mismatch repair protein MutS [Chthoniobacterales bacterium]
MKAFLLYKDQDFDLQRRPPWNARQLIEDLELETLFNAMARGDQLLFDVAKSVILSSLHNDPNTISYRQDILKDCLKNSLIIRGIYYLAVRVVESEKRHYWSFLSNYPQAILDRSISVLHMLVTALKELRNIAKVHASRFQSEGFTSLFSTLQRELTDEYFAAIQNHLKELKFRNGVLISAELGQGNKGTNYILRKSQSNDRNWIERVFADKLSGFVVRIHPRDESGAKALSELRDRGIHLVANALAQSADHIVSFFNILRTELAFYLGCLNLHEQVSQMGEPMSFPLAIANAQRRFSANELYDLYLALRMQRKVVANDINADDKQLVIITGANQGGKSTFLRSAGLAQLMMQSGMFVPAASFSATVCRGIFTHYKREEDPAMQSGKLDEELSRMSEIVDNLRSDSLLLCNESFAATNEREGSEIARQIVTALLDKQIKVFFVTHLYELAHDLYKKKIESALFLRAERQLDGGRTFKLIEGEPLQTSYGEDLYNRIFSL